MAFKEDRILVYFQPIYSFEKKQIERYEALVRIKDHNGNIFTPNYFLDTAESSNQIQKINKIVFLKTLKMIKKCKNKFTFSVNTSFSDLSDYAQGYYIDKPKSTII